MRIFYWWYEENKRHEAPFANATLSLSQNEADPDSDVPFSGDELWLI